MSRTAQSAVKPGTMVGMIVVGFLVLGTCMVGMNQADRQTQAQVKRAAAERLAQVEADRKKEELARQQEIKRQEYQRAAQLALEKSQDPYYDERGPRPVESSWDGITPEANAWLKANLKDYDSMKLVECSVVGKVGKYWGQRVRLRAKNSFGAYVLSEYNFLMRNGQVVEAFETP